MKKILLIISLFFTALVYADDDCAIPEGADAGKPLVKVAPKVSKKVPNGSCALVSFTLKEKTGTEGKALIPESIEIESSTNKKLAKSVKMAVSKWLYLSNSHSTTTKYYYSYVFLPE